MAWYGEKVVFSIALMLLFWLILVTKISMRWHGTVWWEGCFSIALIFLINSSWYLRDGRVNCKMVAFSMFQLLFRLILVDKISAGWQGLARGLLFLLLQRLFRIVLVDKISARWQGMARCSRSWRTRGGMRDSSPSSTRPALPPDMNYTQYQTMLMSRSVFGRLRLLV